MSRTRRRECVSASQPLRIAIVTETFLPKMDGVVRSLLELLRYLRRNGHQAMVFCPGAGETTADGFPVVHAGGVPFPPYPELRLAWRCPTLAPTLRRWQPDVVHLAGPALLGLHGLRAAHNCGVPAAGHFQTNLAAYARHYGAPWLAPLAWKYLTILHNRCAANYLPTQAIAAEARRHGMRRLRVLGRGVDAERFAPGRRSAALRAAWSVQPQDVVALYVGRLAPEKNLTKLIELAHAVPECKLVIVGDGPARAALGAALGDRAHLTGQLQGDALAAAYASADFFAFPSLTETYGQVLQEAMASGLPVLAMRAGGVPEVVEDHRTGLLCHPSAWVATARRLHASPALRSALGSEGRAVAVTRSWAVIFDQLVADYRLLANAAPSVPSTIRLLRRAG